MHSSPKQKFGGGGGLVSKNTFMDVFDNPVTSATSEPTFSAIRQLKKLPKKHNETGLPGQLPTFCHKLITDTLDTVKIACAKEQCKEHFEKI